MAVLEHLGEFWSAWNSFGAFGRVLEHLLRVLERLGEFGRVLKSLGEFCSVWESFGASVRVLEQFEQFWRVW